MSSGPARLSNSWFLGGRLAVTRPERLRGDKFTGARVVSYFARVACDRAGDDEGYMIRQANPNRKVIRVAVQLDPTFVPVHDHLHAAFGFGALPKHIPSRLSPPGRRCTHPPRLRLTRLETRTLLFYRKLREILPIHQTVCPYPPTRPVLYSD